jgi:hypothetical protein
VLGVAPHRLPPASGHMSRKLNPHGLPAHLTLPSGLLQVSNQAGVVTRRSESKVAVLLASSPETRAPVYVLPKLDNYLSNNTRLRNVVAPRKFEFKEK